MEKRNITFSISNDVLELLEKNVPKGERSALIEDLIRSRFNMDMQKKFLDELASGNSSHGHFLNKYNAAKEMTDALQEDDLLSDAELNELDDIV